MNTTTVPAYLARTQFGSLLQEVKENRHRFVITKTGVPTAVLLSIHDFDDIAEELDKEFQKSLKLARNDYQAGKTITLREYMRQSSRLA